MQTNKVLWGLFLLTSLFFVPPVFAGGGLIEIVNTQGPNGGLFAKPGEAYILTFRVHLRNANPYNSSINWCKQCPAKIVFLNPQGGDIVNPLSDKTDDNGEIIAKMSSSAPYVRYAYAIATLPDGTVYEGSQVFLNFTGQLLFYPESNNPIYNLPSNPNPTQNPTPTPISSSGVNVWLLSQQSFQPNGRQATIKWSAFDGNPGTFTIYGKSASNKNNWDKLLEGERGPSATIKIMVDEDYYIKVNGCQDKLGTCVDSNMLLVTKLKETDEKIVSPQNPNPTLFPAPSGDNKQVGELNKKVENLQNQLDQSKKTQSILEQRINDLVNFIKHLFPFFK